MKSQAEQVVFKFGNDYKVFTNYPYIKWFVKWGCTTIGEYDFPNADDWQPERTVTIARARKCFEKSTITIKTAKIQDGTKIINENRFLNDKPKS